MRISLVRWPEFQIDVFFKYIAVCTGFYYYRLFYILPVNPSNRMKKDHKKIAYIAFLLLGTGMITLGIITLKRSMDLIRSGQQTTATVIKLTTYQKKFT